MDFCILCQWFYHMSRSAMMHVVTAIWQSQQLVTTDMMADDVKEEQPSARFLYAAQSRAWWRRGASSPGFIDSGEWGSLLRCQSP